MRDAPRRVRALLPALADGAWLSALDKTKWTQYVATVLAGAVSVAELLVSFFYVPLHFTRILLTV